MESEYKFMRILFSDVERAKKIFQLVRTLLRENLHTAES